MISRKAIAKKPGSKKKKKDFPSLEDTKNAIEKRKKRNQDALKGKFTSTKKKRKTKKKTA